MKKLEFLVGEWKGKGWWYRVNGSKDELSQSTKVKIEADGSALSIKETKRFRGGGLPGVALSRPDSKLSYDEQAKVYRWRVGSSRHRGNPFEVRLPEPKTLQLIMHTQDSMIRNTIRVNGDGEWHETLEILVGEGWFKAQETILKRVK